MPEQRAHAAAEESGLRDSRGMLRPGPVPRAREQQHKQEESVEWLIVVFIAVVIWYWVKGRSSAPSKQSVQRAAVVAEPEIQVTFTTSVSRREKSEPRDVGELTKGANDAWVLNPKAPLPITALGTDQATAEKLKALLDSTEYWSQKIPEIALVIAQHNLRFAEIDAFVGQYKRRFDADVQRLIAGSAEWHDSSEKDRADLRSEFEERALGALGISVGRADFARLLDGQPADFAEDDELLHRFDGDAALYSFYLSQLGRKQSVVNVKADDYGRKSWEQLAEKGFARRGKDIPVQLLLDGLRLKDLNELLAGAIPKPLGRKIKAVEAALALPDLQDRLSARISFREMFEAVAPNGLDVSSLVPSFAYATAVATVVQQTYFTGVKTLDAIDERKQEAGFYDAWEVTNWEDPLPACAAAVCKKYDRLPAKRPPYHVGCSCQLQCAFKD